MAGIMPDHNIEGHFALLLRLWTQEAWKPLWESLSVEIESFERLGIPYETSDRDLWKTCQQRGLVLLTTNRNDDGPDSLEATIRDLNHPCGSRGLSLRTSSKKKYWRNTKSRE